MTQAKMQYIKHAVLVVFCNLGLWTDCLEALAPAEPFHQSFNPERKSISNRFHLTLMYKEWT